jgi:hypothetical protein
MDEHSALYMEQNTKLFPKADPNGILFKLRQFNTSLLQQKLKEAINKTKKELDAEELTSFFQEENILCQHEAVTLIRAFGQKEKGTITIENISQLLLQN